MIKLTNKQTIEKLSDTEVLILDALCQEHGAYTEAHNGQAYACGVEWEKK